MRHLILIVGTILLLCAAVNAQEWTSGITGKGLKLGFDISSINTDYDELDKFLDSRVGFSGGVYLTYAFARQFAVQPEILYVNKGAEKDLFIFSAHWSIDYVEVPVLLKCDLVPKGQAHPNLFAGPAMSILVSSEVGGLGVSYDVTDGMKSVDFGLVFGGGVDYKRITFDIRYTLGLANTVDVAKVNAITGAEPDDFYYLIGDPSVKNTNISFMVGVRI